MPELPDVELYLHALRPRIVDQPLVGVRLRSPFLVRSVDPPVSSAEGRRVVGLRRLGKRIVWEMEDDLDAFPEKVTDFRDGFAVHGRYGEPCPACGTPVQRIQYAENEANYCPTCQTGGKLLADRVLFRLLRDDWPKTLDELEARKAR